MSKETETGVLRLLYPAETAPKNGAIAGCLLTKRAPSQRTHCTCSEITKKENIQTPIPVEINNERITDSEVMASQSCYINVWPELNNTDRLESGNILMLKQKKMKPWPLEKEIALGRPSQGGVTAVELARILQLLHARQAKLQRLEAKRAYERRP